MIDKKQHFDFSDVNLVPQLGIVKSRSECKTDQSFGWYTFKLPIYPSNMESVINPDIALRLAQNGYFYTMHRFLTNDQQMDFVNKMLEKNQIVSISVGVNQESYDLIDRLVKLEVDIQYINVDVAHGHSLLMKNMIEYIDKKLPHTCIIAGNISTVEGARDLDEWGAGAIKVGIAPGKACTTTMATRFGSRGIQASVIKEIADYFQENNIKTEIIADGGIREHGDIAVALTMGATMVMAGSMFVGCKDSPATALQSTETGEGYKEYYGSASSSQSGKINRIEGTSIKIPYKHITILNEMDSIKESLQSAISYAGGNDLKAFNNVKYIINNMNNRITSNGLNNSGTTRASLGAQRNYNDLAGALESVAPHPQVEERIDRSDFIVSSQEDCTDEPAIDTPVLDIPHNSNNKSKTITIEALDFGYIVTVGCQKIAIQNSLILPTLLAEYLANPYKVEGDWFSGKHTLKKGI